MDQHQDYQDRANRVRSLLAAQLEAYPNDPDHFGLGYFVFGGAEYGEPGELGDAIWFVSREDELLHRRRRRTFEWRAYTPEKIAETLLRVYEELASPT
jgi:glycosyltransferase involved in cell wall biosynthesis